MMMRTAENCVKRRKEAYTQLEADSIRRSLANYPGKGQAEDTLQVRHRVTARLVDLLIQIRDMLQIYVNKFFRQIKKLTTEDRLSYVEMEAHQLEITSFAVAKKPDTG